MFLNRNLLVIAIIAVVNALGYGIIIPILYSYSQKFGLTDFQNGLLFSLFSICQFISTPIIGRMSDKFGRKPLLLISLAGTAVSFFVAAFAPSAIFLFLARALDGITAGNIPVASAVISDTTRPKDRAKGFGIIGASFGFGFVVGPAISAFTVGFGQSVPFIIAGVMALIAVVLTAILLPETNKHMGEIRKGKLFDIPALAKAVIDKNVGMTFLISFIYSFSFGMLIFAFQPFSRKIIHLTDQQIAVVFTIIGVVGLISQIILLPRLTRILGDKHMLSSALFLAIIAYTGFFFTRNLPLLTITTIIFALANSFINPLIQTILSKETDEKSQGTVLGLNASYISIGSIFGPIIGGVLESVSVPSPFLFGTFICAICFLLSFKVLKRGIKKESAWS